MIARSAVRLLDISLGGVSLSGAVSLSVTDQAELRTAFEGHSFSSTVEVRWLRAASPEGDAGPVTLGVRFTSLDDESTRALGRFVGGRGVESAEEGNPS